MHQAGRFTHHHQGFLHLGEIFLAARDSTLLLTSTAYERSRRNDSHAKRIALVLRGKTLSFRINVLNETILEIPLERCNGMIGLTVAIATFSFHRKDTLTLSVRIGCCVFILSVSVVVVC